MTDAAAAKGPGERDVAIDALRGLCLLGIALVNVPWIGFRESLASLLFTDSLRASLSPLDLAAAGFVEIFCEGKFYPQFAALFGFGTGIVVSRGMGIYLRRVGVLLVFGLLHHTFGWWGDILLNYALLGFVLALLAKLPVRALLPLALLALIGSTVASFAFDTWFGPQTPEMLAQHETYAAQQEAIYARGSFMDITRQRFTEMLAFFGAYNASYRINTVAMGVFGLWLERAGVVKALLADRARLAKVAWITLGVGIVSQALILLEGHLYLATGDVLAMGYAAVGLLIFSSPRMASVARVLASPGRTAISCYLGQTLAFTLFFYSYGLAMYGRVSPSGGVLLAVSVWAIELVLAHAWLRAFELGPVEWLWRSLTYLRVMPMRRAGSP